MLLRNLVFFDKLFFQSDNVLVLKFLLHFVKRETELHSQDVTNLPESQILFLNFFHKFGRKDPFFQRNSLFGFCYLPLLTSSMPEPNLVFVALQLGGLSWEMHATSFFLVKDLYFHPLVLLFFFPGQQKYQKNGD